jgi:hypothetical protein
MKGVSNPNFKGSKPIGMPLESCMVDAPTNSLIDSTISPKVKTMKG